MNNVAPCKNCEDRKFNCHSKCERYLAFAEYRKRINKAKLKETIMIGIDIDRHYELNRRFKR